MFMTKTVLPSRGKSVGGTVRSQVHEAPHIHDQNSAAIERGVVGSDLSTRGRSPLVLEVRFRSRALFKGMILSEIVVDFLHYLDFCTF